jgi:hypothetical protein
MWAQACRKPIADVTAGRLIGAIHSAMIKKIVKKEESHGA